MEAKEGQCCIHEMKGKEIVDKDPWIHFVINAEHKDKEHNV
jgi:hypothetical protein